MTDNEKILNLKNFDIVLINYVEESKKDELLKGLKELYGEYQPLETGVSSARMTYSTTFPDAKRIVYYDEIDSLIKPLPVKFQSLEIRIVNHITSWCEVICKVRLKQEYLDIAKQEFTDRLEKHNTLSTPDTFEKAHQEFESYISPYIMPNIIQRQDSLKRRAYPFLYIGEVGDLPSRTRMDIVRLMDNTRSGIGWFAVRWASILQRRYLIERTGGSNSELSIQDHGFSILNIAPVVKGKDPDSWGKDTRRIFKASGSEYSIIDAVSSILLPYIALTHRLAEVRDWKSQNVSLAHRIQELSDKDESQDYLNSITGLQTEIEKQRSAFLSESFNIQSESEELSQLTKHTSVFLLGKDYHNFPIEEPFCHPIDAETEWAESLIRSGNPKQGILINMVFESQSKTTQLLDEVRKTEDGQTTLSAYVHDILNASLQKRMDSFAEQGLTFNKSVERLTKWLVRLTLALFVLVVIQAVILIYQLIQTPKP